MNGTQTAADQIGDETAKFLDTITSGPAVRPAFSLRPITRTERVLGAGVPPGIQFTDARGRTYVKDGRGTIRNVVGNVVGQ